MRDLNLMEITELGMSNFDHSVDDGLDKLLKGSPNTYAQYSGWNFCGYVWYAKPQFICQVWQYHGPVKEIEAKSLEDIMNKVSEEYGYQ